MTPEAKVKVKVKKLFAGHNIYAHWPVLNGMGAPTLDCIACVNGSFIAVETKAPGKKPTARQLVTMNQMRTAGAYVFVVSCDEELAVLEAYLMLLGE